MRSLLGGPWVAVAQNVDDDLAWTCPTNPAPEEAWTASARSPREANAVIITQHRLAEVHHLAELMRRVRLDDLLRGQSAEGQVLLLDVSKPARRAASFVRVVRADH